MYILYTIIFAFIIVLLINRNIKKNLINLVQLPLKAWYLLLLAGIIKFIINYITFTNPIVSVKENFLILSIFNVVSLSLVFIFLFINRRGLEGFSFIIWGLFLNILVIITNKGRMPVDTAHAHLLNMPEIVDLLNNGEAPFHVPLTDNTLFPFLADVIPIVNPSLSPALISLGDILLMIGSFIFIYKFLSKP